MIYRTLQTFAVGCIAVGLWRHDWILIVASTSLVLCWWLISEGAEDVTSLGTASSIPHATDGQEAAVTTDPPMRGEEAAPSEIAAAGRLERHRATEEPRRDPQGLVVDSPHLAFMKAHRAWAKRYCPWTLEEWE